MCPSTPVVNVSSIHGLVLTIHDANPTPFHHFSHFGIAMCVPCRCLLCRRLSWLLQPKHNETPAAGKTWSAFSRNAKLPRATVPQRRKHCNACVKAGLERTCVVPPHCIFCFFFCFFLAWLGGGGGGGGDSTYEHMVGVCVMVHGACHACSRARVCVCVCLRSEPNTTTDRRSRLRS